MKIITYHCSGSIVPDDTDRLIPIMGRVCYVFSNSLESPKHRELQNDALERRIKRVYRDDVVLFLPDNNDEMLTLIRNLFLKLFGTATDNDNTQPPTILSKQPYDDNDLGGPEQAMGVKEKMAERGGKDVSPSHITFVETIKEINVEKQQLEGQLQKLLDDIVTDPYNEVEAAFITLLTDELDPILYQSRTSKNSNKKPIDIGRYGPLLGKFDELRKKMDPIGGESLKEAIFHFEKGVVNITLLGVKRQRYFFLVSTADNALADVALVRRDNLGEVVKLLKQLNKID